MPNEKKLVSRARKNKPIRQIATVPYRIGADGDVEVLLVTSRTTRRFIVPKGWPMKHKGGRGVAAQEAYEEAGVSGTVSKAPVGTYFYWKRLSDNFVKVNVEVFLLAVRKTLDEWEEAETRGRAWLSPRDAAALIDEPELSALVLSFSGISPEAMRKLLASG